MSHDLVKILARRHPKAALCATVTSFNHPLLISQQLRRLNVSIPRSNVDEFASNQCFWQLREAILSLPNLRSLTVDVHQAPKLIDKAASVLRQPGQNHYWTETRDAGAYSTVDPTLNIYKVQIPFQPTDKIPPLEELNIEATTYDFDEQHCSVLLDCIDWTKIKRLKLGTSNSQLLFEYLLGCLPQLQCLDFAAKSTGVEHRRLPGYYRKTNLHAYSRFLRSIVSLRELTVRCDLIDFADEFWAHLSEDLESLSILPRVDGLDCPQIQPRVFEYGNQNQRQADSLRNLLTTLPNLIALRLSLPTWNDNIQCRGCAHEFHAHVSLYLQNMYVCSAVFIDSSILFSSGPSHTFHL